MSWFYWGYVITSLSLSLSHLLLPNSSSLITLTLPLASSLPPPPSPSLLLPLIQSVHSPTRLLLLNCSMMHRLRLLEHRSTMCTPTNYCGSTNFLAHSISSTLKPERTGQSERHSRDHLYTYSRNTDIVAPHAQIFQRFRFLCLRKPRVLAKPRIW